MRHLRRTQIIGFCLLILSILITSCRAQGTPTRAPNQPTATTANLSTTTPVPTPTTAPRSLVVCLGQEPQTLYPYGPGSAAQWSILEAVYDGPIDHLGASGDRPVILKKLPSLADQDAQIKPVAVQPGDEIVDSAGNLAVLAKGVSVRPSGCSGADCAVPYDGKSSLEMDQMQVRFQLLPDLTWSDGASLQASDSVYAYKLAADKATPVSKTLVDRTASYKALDPLTVEWTGIPGFLDPGYQEFFWMPLPEHLWGALSPTDLLTAQISARQPVGWGPYVITEWVAGDHILLKKNPHYFRAKEGLPKFDTLDFRFIGENSNANLNTVLTGECDLLAQTTHMEEQLTSLDDLQKAGKLKTQFAAGPEWEHLDFGIKPASYDDGFNLAVGDRPNFFGDVRVRQAFAYCSDRQAVVDQLLQGKSYVPDTYLPRESALYNQDVKQYSFDPQKGIQLLEAVGWKDMDSNPDTPRVAQGVSGVLDGTPFTVTYLTTQAELRVKAAQVLQASLAKCGIQVKIQSQSPGDLFAPGPDGLLFGRKFDLAQFSWQAGERPECFLYQTNRIPDTANHWVGENIAGYSNAEYDQACQASLQLPVDPEAVKQAQGKAQEIFANDLPVLPLYMDLNVDVTRPDFCGFQFIPAARSDLWNIETYDYGPDCKGS